MRFFPELLAWQNVTGIIPLSSSGVWETSLGSDPTFCVAGSGLQPMTGEKEVVNNCVQFLQNLSNLHFPTFLLCTAVDRYSTKVATLLKT